MASHALDGIVAIGSGTDVAMSTMLVLGQNRAMTLEETLYSVASAKFAAERCEGVGRTTTMFVSWKRTDNDPENRRSGNFVHPPTNGRAKEGWDKYGKPRIPHQGWNLFSTIATGLYEGRGRAIVRKLKPARKDAKIRRSGLRPFSFSVLLTPGWYGLRLPFVRAFRQRCTPEPRLSERRICSAPIEPASCRFLVEGHLNALE